MKQLVKVEEVPNEGLIGLMGKRVTLFCMNYTYTGDLVGVNDTFVKLSKGGIVFETGPFHEKAWKDYQSLPNDVYIQTRAIESFMILK